MDLAELMNHYGTDKDVNGYCQLYHTLFDGLRKEPLTILEVGIGTLIAEAPSSMLGYAARHYKPGGSLRAWRDYFPNARVIGIDTQPDTQFSEERIETYLCDSRDVQAVAALIDQIGVMPDVIIDDGSHLDTDQLATAKALYPHLLPQDGVYVIEDIYPGSRVSNDPVVLEEVFEGDPFFYVGKKSNLCIAYKNRLTSQRRGY